MAYTERDRGVLFACSDAFSCEIYSASRELKENDKTLCLSKLQPRGRWGCIHVQTMGCLYDSKADLFLTQQVCYRSRGLILCNPHGLLAVDWFHNSVEINTCPLHILQNTHDANTKSLSLWTDTAYLCHRFLVYHKVKPLVSMRPPLLGPRRQLKACIARVHLQSTELACTVSPPRAGSEPHSAHD